MTTPKTTSKSAFWAGYRDCLPFILVAGPFGLLFGVAATDLGLNLLETMTMTVSSHCWSIPIHSTFAN
jgi:predicted branched-subunit amino acid permease